MSRLYRNHLIAVTMIAFIASSAPFSISKQGGGWLEPDPEPEPRPVVVSTRDPVPVEEIVFIPEPTVSLPSSRTVWEHGQQGSTIRWIDFEGELIKIELLRGGQVIGEITSTEWVENEGFYRLSGAVSNAWGSGRNFQIRVTSITGDWAESEVFQIKAPIDVSIPDSQTRWATGENNIEISWSGAPGSSVQIALHKNGLFVDSIADWMGNTGTFFVDYPIPEAWGTGSGYTVVVTDNLGNSYASQEFVIDGIWVYSPSQSSVWHKGRAPREIGWVGGGQAVRVDLYNGNSLVRELTNGWSDNRNSFQLAGAITADWSDSPFYRIHVRSMDASGEILEGWSGYFAVLMSNSLIQGAEVLEQSVSGAIEARDEYDYYRFATQGRMVHGLSLRADSEVKVELIAPDSVTVIEVLGSSGIQWIPERSDVYFLRVFSTAEGRSNYQISLSRRLPPERVRRFQIGGWYGFPLTGMREAVPDGFGGYIAYSPVSYLDAGAEWISLDTGEDIDYYNVIWGRQSFIGGFAGVRSPEIHGLRARAGAGYFIRMNSDEILLKSQYASYSNAISDGVKWYAGIDYKLFSSHFGAALYAGLRYYGLNGADGLLSIGTGLAF